MGWFDDFVEDTVDFFTEDIPNTASQAVNTAGRLVTGKGNTADLLETLGNFAGIAIGNPLSGSFTRQALGSADKKAGDRAEDLIRQGMDEAQAVQRAAQERINEIFGPYAGAGATAVPGLQQLAGITQNLGLESLSKLGEEALAPPGFSPGERFQLAEGTKALRQGAAARGLFKSGASLEAERDLAQKIAAQSEARRSGQRQSLANLALSTQFGLTDVGRSLASPAASLAFQTGAGQAQTLTSGTSALAQLPYLQQANDIQRLSLIPQTIAAAAPLFL